MRSGIIPARAGFTSSTKRTGRRTGDHPRSRGVYTPLTASNVVCMGSSPLARGLLVCECLADECWGIIPARAGFTSRPPTRRKPHPDHPRSRGVYEQGLPAQLSLDGSSPLARGLRGNSEPVLRARRIIPARAGFTERSPNSGHQPSDHPRSRGVYLLRPRHEPHVRGSSPLARGLLVDQDPVRRIDGIIPARAGFTPGCPRQRRGCWDHPRSRGVYRCG